VLGLEGEPLQGLSKSPSSPATPHKHRDSVLLHRFYSGVRGCFPSLVLTCPPPPRVEPHSSGACPSSAPHNPSPQLYQQVGGGGTQGEPPTCQGRQSQAR